ncbi:MAG: SDR family NAD(P)-dependent oxidoreductase [Candidatus Taylorbacteria bacterium]|nr:SDR family NAD(P)-dependent oxidoreductase [Candidatus Taylorbacteria bacterium]
MDIFKGKTILVTGGTGSIGSEIVRQLLLLKPQAIRVFARHEDLHFQLMQELVGHEDVVRFVVGDIRDKDRLALAMEGVDIVFHAAAMKHVPLCEYNPFEAVKTNIVGTQNVIEAARVANVAQVIGISTDKVTEPESVLGVSKLMAEKLFLATYFYKGNTETKFTCVRFGNVLGSRGSILSLIKKCVAKGQSVPVTDPTMTRFFMTIPQAVALVLEAARGGKGQEVFVLKMPAARLGDLVKAAISYYSPLFGKKPSDVKTRIIGKRKGERMHEKLLAEYEIPLALETKTMYILTPHGDAFAEYEATYPASPVRIRDKGFSSEFARKLSGKELLALIKEADRYHE